MDDESTLDGCDAVTTSHGEIRRWVRQHGGRPAVREAAIGDGTATGDEATAGGETVTGDEATTGGETVTGDGAALALQFPGADALGLAPIDWDDFFARFEGAELALAYAADPGPSVPETAHGFVDLVPVDEPDAVRTDATGAPENDREPGDDPTAERAVEDRSAVRGRAAEADANADDHRDEPPHNS